ncbi:hypothetical protein E2C01_093337 [Portunus trituberculatus]|uniref:Uncharacterized protein n=1 Tax=Portunus trituberculatus TaxID=210409 RepID=A0A5B7JYA3_PORTR|nr:hypothetical protein [Portunus trituberculatus]
MRGDRTATGIVQQLGEKGTTVRRNASARYSAKPLLPTCCLTFFVATEEQHAPPFLPECLLTLHKQHSYLQPLNSNYTLNTVSCTGGKTGRENVRHSLSKGGSEHYARNVRFIRSVAGRDTLKVAAPMFSAQHSVRSTHLG